MSDTIYVVVLEVATNELRIHKLRKGTRPLANPACRCHGPYSSAGSARRAVRTKSSKLQSVLYGDAAQFVTHPLIIDSKYEVVVNGVTYERIDA